MIATETTSDFSSLLVEFTQGHDGNFAVRNWDAQVWEPHPGEPVEFTLSLRHPGSLRAMFWPFSNTSLGDAYIFGDCDVDGSMVALTGWFEHMVDRIDRLGVWGKTKLLARILALPKGSHPKDPAKTSTLALGVNHTKERDRADVSFSYDFPGELYRIFLDKNVQYTCGYFASSDQDLDSAQERKLDYLCKKLNLQPGQRLLDVGCGLGGLAMYAARRFGARVVGVTLSHVQAEWAKKAVAEAGLNDLVRIVECDYRDFNEPSSFDKASCVGMAEHVGIKNIPTLYRKIFDSLKPGGVFFHQCITLRPHTPYPRCAAFAWKYVFPNAELPSITKLLEVAAKVGFEIRDVESLREHYSLTLEHWVRRLEANYPGVLEWTDEVGYRIFRIYFAGCTHSFNNGIFNLNHSLLVKPDAGRAGMPLTRAAWFAH